MGAFDRVQITAFKEINKGKDKSVFFEWDEEPLRITWEDIAFLKKIREIGYGNIGRVILVNGKVSSFEDPKKNVKIF